MGYFIQFKTAGDKANDELIYIPDKRELVKYIEASANNSEAFAKTLINEARFFEVEVERCIEDITINGEEPPDSYGFIKWRPLNEIILVEKKWRVIEAPDIPEDTDVQTGYGR